MDIQLTNYTLIFYGYDNERQKWEKFQISIKTQDKGHILHIKYT